MAPADLDRDVFVKSASAPRNSRWRTLVDLGAREGPKTPAHLLPLTREKLRLFGAAFEAGGYRSGGEYLGVAKARHLQKGYLCDSVLRRRWRTSREAWDEVKVSLKVPRTSTYESWQLVD